MGDYNIDVEKICTCNVPRKMGVRIFPQLFYRPFADEKFKKWHLFGWSLFYFIVSETHQELKNEQGKQWKQKTRVIN